jgi:hypothetical protein
MNTRTRCDFVQPDIELIVNPYDGCCELYLEGDLVDLDLIPRLVALGILTEEEAATKHAQFTTKVPLTH